MLIYDIECDSLDPTVIHCICIYDSNTGDLYNYYDGNARPGFQQTGTVANAVSGLRHAAGEVVCHNQSGYDIPAILKITNININNRSGKIIDTLVLSNILFPENPKHSLEFWAEELGLPMSKVQNEDWSALSDVMLDRCGKDVLINYEVWKYLDSIVQEDFLKDQINWWPAHDLECEVARIHQKQVVHGVRFDVMKAAELLKLFNSRVEVLTEEITLEAPLVQVISWKSHRDKTTELMVREAPTVAAPFKKNGQLSLAVQKYFGFDHVALGNKHLKRIIDTVAGPFSKVSWRPINLNSSAEVKQWLLSEGWKPTQYNVKKDVNGRFINGSPKITEELIGLEGSKVGSKFNEYNIIKHRRNFLLSSTGKTGALTNVRPDGRISAEAQTCATPTARYRHSGSVCNIPRPGTPYGQEIRELFCVPEGRQMIGIDLSGIEARMMCHYSYDYPGGAEFAKLVLDGDFHQHNADMWGVDRNTSKTALYALMYGCGDTKLANTLGKPKSQGAKLKAIFWKGNPALAALLIDLERSYDYHGGWITGLDGRKLFIRDKRKLLNSLLQNAAAIVFKKWMVLCDVLFALAKVNPIAQTIAYHDEIQCETDASIFISNEYGDKICRAAEKVGQDLNLKVPIAAEYKVGMNWAETH